VILLQLNNLHLTAPESMQQADKLKLKSVWEYVGVSEYESVCVYFSDVRLCVL